VSLLDEIENLVFVHIALDDEGSVDHRGGEVKLDATEPIAAFEDEITFRVRRAVLPFEAHVVHLVLLLMCPGRVACGRLISCDLTLDWLDDHAGAGADQAKTKRVA